MTTTKYLLQKYKMIKKKNPVFFQEFRSVTFNLSSETAECEFPMPIHSILNWLSEYDLWWTKAAGISKGKNLHLLYGRYVTCTGSRLLRFIPEILEIASLSSTIGCIFALELGLNESLEHIKLFDNLLRSGRIGELSIIANSINKKNQSYEYISLIEMVVRNGISLNLVGPMNFWEELGILESPILNSSSFRIIPTYFKKRNYSHLNHSTLCDTKTGKDNSIQYSFNPCSERFQIYVAPDGALYPCKGLIGIPSCVMGTIYDEIENTVLTGGKDSFLDFKNLAKSGPKLQIDDTISDFEGLTPICLFHRNSILKTISDQSVLD